MLKLWLCDLVPLLTLTVTLFVPVSAVQEIKPDVPIVMLAGAFARL